MLWTCLDGGEAGALLAACLLDYRFLGRTFGRDGRSGGRRLGLLLLAFGCTCSHTTGNLPHKPMR